MQLTKIFNDEDKLIQLSNDVFHGEFCVSFTNTSGTIFNNQFADLDESYRIPFSSIKHKAYYSYFVDVAEQFYKKHNLKFSLPNSKILIYPSAHDGIVHTDADLEDTLTTITFLNLKWESTWGGEILCYSEDLKVVVGGVTPQFGKTFIFNGKIPHRAVAPIRILTIPRIVLVTKEE